MDKICVKCGNKLKKGVKFCTFCGQKVEEIKEEAEPKVEQSEKSQPTKKTTEPELKSSVKEKWEPAPTPQMQEIPAIIPPETKPSKQSKPVDRIIIPAIIIALILSVAAIILPFIVGGEEELSAGIVDTEALASNSVTTEKIADGTITDDDIINTGISKIAKASIKGDNIIENAIGFKHLNADVYDNITSKNEIANGSITSEKIAPDAVDSSKIKNGAVGTSEIADDAITSEDIGDNEVTFNKLNTKIRFGIASISSNDTINHNLEGTPTSVVVTPVFGDSNYIIYANIVSVTSTQFTVGLWKETFTSPPVITEVTSDVTIYWVAMR